MKDSVLEFRKIMDYAPILYVLVFCSFSVFSFSWEEGQSWNVVEVPSLLLSILAVESSISMSLCVSVVVASHWKRSSKSPMQFFVDDLVVGLAMLFISSLEMERLFPSFLGKASGMKSWWRSSNEMQVGMGLKYMIHVRIQSSVKIESTIWFL